MRRSKTQSTKRLEKILCQTDGVRSVRPMDLVSDLRHADPGDVNRVRDQRIGIFIPQHAADHQVGLQQQGRRPQAVGHRWQIVSVEPLRFDDGNQDVGIDLL